MGKRQRTWARKERVRIQHILGDKCTDCGGTENIEFDCIEPRGHGHHSKEASWRISFYRKQMREGNLALRCTACHLKKTARQNKPSTPATLSNSTTDQGSLTPTVLLRVVNSVNNYETPVLDGGTAGGSCE